MNTPETAGGIGAREMREQFWSNVCEECPAATGEVPEIDPFCSYFDRNTDYIDGGAVMVTNYDCSNPAVLQQREVSNGVVSIKSTKQNKEQ